MKFFQSAWAVRCFRFFSLLAAGAVSALIFPPFVNCAAGYVVFVCFLAYLFNENRSAKELFYLAYGFGFGFYAAGFCWISNALLIDDGQFAGLVPVVFLATGAFFGLFWAIPAMISKKGKNVYTQMLLFCAAFVVFEWIRSFIFTGFPWNLLGTALSFDVRLIQGAAYIGTYGLSLMLLVFLCGIALLLISGYRRCFLRGSLFFILVPLGFIGAVSLRYTEAQSNQNGLVVRLVQPSIPQTLKWNPESAYKNFRKYIDLSRQGGRDDKVDLVVWGETACPYFLDYDREHLAEIVQAIPQDGFLVTGLLRIGFENGEQVPYNSMYVINGKGEIKDYYDKAHLVPFGEYLPFRKYLPDFVKPIANVVGDLGQGEKYKNIHVDGLPVMGGAICYESIFPKEILNPKEKPEILAVLANDGWYGVSAGPYQHLAAAQMRAVEEGISIIRSANTGISAVIFSNGEILGRIGLNDEGILDVKLPVKLSQQTFYGRYGNWVVGGLVLLVLFLVILLDSINNCSKNREKAIF